MIKDPLVRQEIKQEWQVIVNLVNWSRVWMSPNGSCINETPPDEFYNLPLVLAYSTLDSILGQLLIEGAFACTSGKNKTCFNLGDKMLSAKSALPWVDFALIDKGRDARNGLAHRNVVASRADCLRYVNAMGAELKNWGLIP